MRATVLKPVLTSVKAWMQRMASVFGIYRRILCLHSLKNYTFQFDACIKTLPQKFDQDVLIPALQVQLKERFVQRNWIIFWKWH